MLSRSEWIQSVSLKRTSDLVEFVNALLISARPAVLRGVSEEIALLFRNAGGHVFQSGIEATIDLNDTAWHRSSLRELARRALRYGHIQYFPASQTDRPFPDLSDLRSRSAYANMPALRGLYLTDASQWHKAWSFVVDGQVVGLVTATCRGEQSYHTEVLMRAKNAPKGTMEALIIRAATDLQAEGATELSLGECPFVVGSPPDIRVHLYGRMMAHAYHARGLYTFKAKFRPQWRPVFMVSRRRLFLPLVDLFFKTGSAALFFSALFER
jgi:lysylphosphatidylglycerol synthetase-like protein (DUF2156 family)